jgi:hypothetical protein
MDGTGEHCLKVKLIRLRKTKITCSSSYVDYCLKRNANIRYGLHTKGRTCVGGIGKGKET